MPGGKGYKIIRLFRYLSHSPVKADETCSTSVLYSPDLSPKTSGAPKPQCFMNSQSVLTFIISLGKRYSINPQPHLCFSSCRCAALWPVSNWRILTGADLSYSSGTGNNKAEERCRRSGSRPLHTDPEDLLTNY